MKNAKNRDFEDIRVNLFHVTVLFAVALASKFRLRRHTNVASSHQNIVQR